MACGTAVVVSDIDGIGDIVASPATGRILAETKPTTLYGDIRDLLGAPDGHSALAEQFDWQGSTQGQIDLFHEICEAPR
jgi:teichuronic acid biosynthesis glycosyltransferase TuaC